MSIKNNQSLWSSVILHGALIIALFLSTIIEAFLPKEKPHVFEMVSQSSPSNAAPSPAAPTNTPPNLELPDVPPMDIADPVIPMAAPTLPKPVAKPRPQPTPVKATPEPLISAADFFKENPKKDPKPRPPQPANLLIRHPQSIPLKFSKICRVICRPRCMRLPVALPRPSALPCSAMGIN